MQTDSLLSPTRDRVEDGALDNIRSTQALPLRGSPRQLLLARVRSLYRVALCHITAHAAAIYCHAPARVSQVLGPVMALASHASRFSPGPTSKVLCSPWRQT